MFEILVISGALIVVIIGIGWFVYRRRRIDDSDFKFTQQKRHDPKIDDDTIIEDFDDIYKRELSPDEPSGAKESEAAPDNSEPSETPEDISEQKATQSEISFDDEVKADEVIVIAFTIMADKDMRFTGSAVSTALSDSEFEYGSSQFFHLLDLETQLPQISVANVLSPGTLDPDDFSEMSTPGLLMFSQFIGAENDLALFDQLLDKAEQLTDKLGGTLSDEMREPINDLKLKEMHDKIRDLKIL